jgi:hypothetical protein
MSDIKELHRMREAALRAFEDAKAQLDRARVAHERAAERVQHVQALIDLERPASETRASISKSNSGTDSSATDAAVQILKQRAPLHYRELYAEVERLGVMIKSASPANTFLTRMLRDGRFRPTGQRGYYELAPEGHEHFRPIPQRKKGAA